MEFNGFFANVGVWSCCSNSCLVVEDIGSSAESSRGVRTNEVLGQDKSSAINIRRQRWPRCQRFVTGKVLVFFAFIQVCVTPKVLVFVSEML